MYRKGVIFLREDNNRAADNNEPAGNAGAGEAVLEPGTARHLFLAVIITSFIGPFAGSGINVAVPAIGQEFGASANDLSWVVFGYLLGAAMFTRLQASWRIFWAGAGCIIWGNGCFH